MFKQKIEDDLKKVIEDLGYQSTDIVCSIPKNLAFGDYTTNIALQLANQKSRSGKQTLEKIANEIVTRIKSLESSKEYLEKVEVAGPGFINFSLKDETLLLNVPRVCNYSAFVNPEVELNSSEKKKVLVEYAHPNTHKQFHIGHLRNINLGETIARLLESSGNEVFRANYEGDIGLHVAKALWGLKRIKNYESRIKEKDVNERQKLLGEAYVLGTKAYEEREGAKIQIQQINKQLYARDPKIIGLWEKTRQWSLDYFDLIYKKLGTKFDGFVFESEVEERGQQIVRDNVGEIFEKDQGAIIFPGDRYGLHNRVFITSEGHPTYEAKDLGRAEAERKAFDFDQAVHVVATDQSGYFQVMFKALELVDPYFLGKNYHLAYGMVKLATGKMASRTGDVVTFDWLYEEVKKKVAEVMSKAVISAQAGIQRENKFNGSPIRSGMTKEEKQSVIDIVSIGAIKFSMLKYSPQTDITFDIEKSVSLLGDSGPYLQYTYARAKSVLRTAAYNYTPGAEAKNLEIEERLILQRIEHFEVVLEESAKNYSPNTLAEYLLDLARSFNLFYQKHPIIKSEEKMELRLALTCAVAVILKQGLYLLGIDAPERM